MNKIYVSSTFLGVLLGMGSAQVIAGDDGSRGRARLAEQVQSAMTYLPTRNQTANVWNPSGGPGLREGAAWLVRSKNGIHGRVMANVPTAGDPYTVWMVVFSNPSACVDGCDGADIANLAVGASVFNASGAIAADNGSGGGVINVDFETVAGDLPTDRFILVGDPRGLLRDHGFVAEVHIVIDHHPTITPGSMSWISDLTTTNFPGAGPNVTVGVAVFASCPAQSCPDSAL